MGYRQRHYGVFIGRMVCIFLAAWGSRRRAHGPGQGHDKEDTARIGGSATKESLILTDWGEKKIQDPL